MWAFNKTHLTLEGEFFWYYKGFHFSRKDLLTLIDGLIYKTLSKDEFYGEKWPEYETIRMPNKRENEFVLGCSKVFVFPIDMNVSHSKEIFFFQSESWMQ